MPDEPLITFVFPERSSDEISGSLRALTRQIHEAGLADAGGFGLGGEFGYGVDYESAVFLMKPYCCCEKESCRWCSENACGCPHPKPEHYFDGNRVDDWCKYNDMLVAPLPYKIAKHDTPEYDEAERIFDASIDERDRRLKTIWPERVHSCEPKGLMANRPRGNYWLPNQCAPNFWHKPSNSRIWWYKWIGRGMEVQLLVSWGQIIDECMEAVKNA